jgi:hypothetical protein
MGQLQISSGQRRRLQRQRDSARDARLYHRTLALLEFDRGRPPAAIARLLRVTRQTVYNWIDTYRRTGDPRALADADRPGRPRPLGAAAAAILERLRAQSPLPRLEVSDAIPSVLARGRFRLQGCAPYASVACQAEEGRQLLMEEVLTRLEAEGRIRRAPPSPLYRARPYGPPALPPGPCRVGLTRHDHPRAQCVETSARSTAGRTAQLQQPLFPVRWYDPLGLAGQVDEQDSCSLPGSRRSRTKP